MTRDDMLNFSMFILRIILGIIFMAHGAQKLFGMFGGIGIDGTAKMVEGLGLPYPEVLAIIWACVEFVGGIFLILGITSRWTAIAIVMLMFISTFKINITYGFFIQNGGIEYNLLVIGSCIPLILIGGGSWSVWDV
jgi:putative oxidoreductase